MIGKNEILVKCGFILIFVRICGKIRLLEKFQNGAADPCKSVAF